jgi:hypothetical protein
MSKGLNTNTLTVDIYCNSLREYSTSLFTNICASTSTGSSCGLPAPTWRCASLAVPFSPSEAYYPLLNEMSNSWIVLWKNTNPPSITPLVVESRYKSFFYHVISGRVTLQILLLPSLSGRVTFHLFPPLSSFYHDLVVVSRFNCFLLSAAGLC